MSKRVSKLSRKCTTKNVQALKSNTFDKSSDDFEDDTRTITRNSVTRSNKDVNSRATKGLKCNGSNTSIASVCKKLAVNSDVKHIDDKENSLFKNGDRKKNTDITHQGNKCRIDYTTIKSRSSKEVSSTNIEFISSDDTENETVNEKPLDIEPYPPIHPQNRSEESSASRIVSKLAPCPLCGKEFKAGLEGKRIVHLKECGSLLGVPTEDLVKMRRLEVRIVVYLIARFIFYISSRTYSAYILIYILYISYFKTPRKNKLLNGKLLVYLKR